MVTLDAEGAADGAARRRELPGAARTVGKLEARARIGARPGSDVPLIGYGDRFREIQRDGPAADRSGAGVGNRYIHLERVSRTGSRYGTSVCSECLPIKYQAQQQAGHEHAHLYQRFHYYPLTLFVEKPIHTRPAQD